MKRIFITFLLIVTMLSVAPLTMAGIPEEPHSADAMWIEPSFVDVTGAPVGYKFNVTVWANSSKQVKGWQFWLYYPNQYINATRCGYTAGDKSEFFQNITAMPVLPHFVVDYNETHNKLEFGEAWIIGPYRNPGYGSLCWIEFEIINPLPEGEVVNIPLDIKYAYEAYEPPKTYLYYYDGTMRPLSVYNAYVGTLVTVIHDIAISDVTVFPKEVYVGDITKVHIEVTNLGTENETFTLQIYCNETLLYEEENSIEAGKSKTIEYYWNTEGTPSGTYVITVKALLPEGVEDVNPDNNVSEDTLTIRAIEKEPPVASFTYSPYSPKVGESVTFDASESYDPDGGEIIQYGWDFGDGKTGYGKVVTHSYESEGTYYVTLTVIDDENQSGTLTQPITVLAEIPAPKFEITMEPWCTNGTYPEWKNITICNIGGGCITKMDITHPVGYKFGKLITPLGWKVNYNPDMRLITLEAEYPSAGISGGECEVFRIMFSDGPKEQGIYVFSVMVSNPTSGYHERKDLYQYIDTTPPQVEIITPINETVIKKGGFWVNATASDQGICPCCGIDRVELYINGEFWGIMNYDEEKDVYHLWIESLPYSETYYNIVAKAYDKAGNIAHSKVTIFWVGAEAEIEIYNKVIYDNYGEKKAYGHVESKVYVKGITGFTPNAEIEIYFEDDLIKRIRADKYGRFLTTITIPEVPRGTYTIKAVEVGCPENQDSATVTVYPWMFASDGKGYVGDTFTVEGKGFAANVEVLVYYRDVAKCSIHWDEWATEWWNETDYMEWNPVLDEVIVARVRTDQKGSFTAAFTIPESYGGLHPIYGVEKISGIRSGYPSDELWPDGLNQCVTFHVKTNIWITPSTGVAEQYVTLYATGLPIPYGYSLKINDEYVYYERQWSLALDFGPHKYWIWEHNYVMNNEIDVGWLTGVRFPVYFYNTCPYCNRVWNGTLCWADIDLNLHEGSPFLKVPNLINGEYTIKLYFFDEETLQDVYDYGDEEEFTIIKDPLTVKVEVGSIHFPDEIVTVFIKTDVDGNTADISQMTVKLFHETELVSTLEWSRIDEGLYYVSFNCPSDPGTYIIIVSAAKQYESFILYAEGTANFVVSPTLGDLNARLQDIENGIVSINSTVGIISFRIEDLGARIENIEDNIATISTDIGKIKADIKDIIEEIKVIKEDVVSIKTKLETTILGKIEKIEGNVATISTDVGDIKTNVENISGLEENIGGYGSMQTVSVAFSMIAAFAAIIVVAIVLRRGYKK